MKGKSFFGLIKPQIVYPSTAGIASTLKQVASPRRGTFLIRETIPTSGDVLLKVGDTVKTGQKLALTADTPGYAISSITGTISAIAPLYGDMGQTYTAVTIDASDEADEDDAFPAVAGEPNLETAAAWLDAVPGAPELQRFMTPGHGIHTLVILGVDADLLVGTQRQVLTSHGSVLKNGIDILKQITGIEHLVLVTPKDRFQGHGYLGAEVKTVDHRYPSTLPRLVMKDVLGKVVPAGKSEEDMGYAFISAEAVANVGIAYETKKLPAMKFVTVIHKDGSTTLVQADLGTPVKDLLDACGESVNEKDRLIIGGPMAGSAVYSDLYPVGPNTDAVMVQDQTDISPVVDADCINCGECVRICPVNIPVNLLVRFLAAGAYDDAVDLYDLHACIECGLCTFVCVARLPISQHIRLGKYELERTKAVEETND
jgi:electron transport complex protein RnfC